METKPYLFPQAKIRCWMTLRLSREPIIVYPKQHRMSTRVSLRSLGALATRARTIRGFSKILLNCPTAHQAKIFKIINSPGNPIIQCNIWTQISKQDLRAWCLKAPSWAHLKMEWPWYSLLDRLKLAQIFPVSNQKSLQCQWEVCSKITVIEQSV